MGGKKKRRGLKPTCCWCWILPVAPHSLKGEGACPLCILYPPIATFEGGSAAYLRGRCVDPQLGCELTFCDLGDSPNGPPREGSYTGGN